MGTGVQNRPQSPAFQVTGLVAHQNGFKNAGAPAPTPRNQKRVGAGETPIQHTNGTKVAQAGFNLPESAAVNPTTRTASAQHSRQSARGITGTNYASKKGSGSNNLPKSIAGTSDVFNVGGTGGRSAQLVHIPSAANAPAAAKSSKVAKLKVRNGMSKGNDPTEQPLQTVMTPVHMGFNHVGYRKS
jgi:hypothetical protein